MDCSGVALFRKTGGTDDLLEFLPVGGGQGGRVGYFANNAGSPG